MQKGKVSATHSVFRRGGRWRLGPGMVLGLLFGMWFVPGHVNLARSGEPAALEGALWRGTLTLHIQGPLQSQFLANRTNEQGIIIGYLKSKAKMKVDYQLEFRFLVNALGEFTMSADARFEGEKVQTSEYWYQYMEDVQIEKTKVTTRQMVRVSENREKIFNFSDVRAFTDTNFDLGSFRILPSGRMDRKGEIRVVGEIKPVFQGQGKIVHAKERRPSSKEHAGLKTETEARTSFMIPIEFQVTVQHKKKAVQMPVNVKISIENPFDFEDKKENEKDLFRHSVTATGSLQLTPLFGEN